jgi:hypothetical protein
MVRAGAVLIMSACAVSGLAHAEPGAVSSVSGASVTADETRIEVRSAAFQGGALDESWNHRAQVGYGFTDWWQSTLILRASQPASDSAELTSIGLENRFEFTATRDWPMQLAGQFEYKFGLHGRDDEVELKLLAERTIGEINLRLNLNAAHELSDGAEWAPAYAARLAWSASDLISLGVEAFGETEIDAHYLGPRAAFKLGPTTLSLGYLAGFDDANADAQFRLALELAR